MNLFRVIVFLSLIYASGAIPIKRAVFTDIRELSIDLSRGSETRKQEIFTRIMELTQNLEKQPSSWPEFLTRAISNDVEGVTPQMASSVLRGRRWNTEGNAWDNFTYGQGSFGDLVSKAKSKVVEKVASIVAGMDRFMKKLSASKKEKSNESSNNDSAGTMTKGTTETPLQLEGSATASANTRSTIEPPIPCRELLPHVERIAKPNSDAFNAYATPSAIGASTNIGNPNAEAFMATASASAVGASTNVGNANAEAIKASASASATGSSVNMGNANAQIMSASASANVGAMQANMGNLNVSPLTASASASLAPSVSAFNADISPGSFSVSANPGSFSFGNVGFGGISLSFPQLQNLFNFGSGGGGGGGGSSGGSSGDNGDSSGGSRTGGNGNPGRSGTGGNDNSGSSRSGTSGNGIGSSWAQKKADILRKIPNIHYDENGDKYVNGVKVLHKSKRYLNAAKGSTIEGEASVSNNPDPLGVPLEHEVPRMLEGHVTVADQQPLSLSGADPTSCAQSVLIGNAHVKNLKQISGITHENVGPIVDDLISGRNNVLAMQLLGGGDHLFMVTGHRENVVVTNSWQGSHTLRNEPPMARAQFINHMETILNPGSTTQDRQSAASSLFNCNNFGNFATSQVRVATSFHGVIESPIVRRPNTSFGSPGLIPEPRAATIGTRPRSYQPPSFLSHGQVPNESSSNSESTISDLSAEEQNQVNALIEQYIRENYENIDAEEVQQALEYASSESGLKETEKEQEKEDPAELCDYCRARGRVSCFRCLVNRGGRKIVRHGNSNVHGFASN